MPRDGQNLYESNSISGTAYDVGRHCNTGSLSADVIVQ